MRIITILLITCLPFANALAQAFAFVPGSSADAGERVGGHKKAVAQKVFDALQRARGDYRLQPPTFLLVKQGKNMATFNPDLVQIVLEEKAYDVCMSFGPDSLNALAALLAHELTHYYENHNWSRHFVQENHDLEAARHLENMEEGLRHEAQADCLGGFLAFSAGFEPYGIMPEMLRRLYRAYGLGEELPGYPTLSERVRMTETAMGQLKSLQSVFETANRLTILGHYAEAAAYHRHILLTYQSSEVFNNAGVNAALAALAYVPPVELPFLLPLELDPRSRLFSLKNNDREQEERKKTLLKMALEDFDRAILLDANYAPAYLNKASVLAMQKEWDDMEYTIRKARKKALDDGVSAGFLVLEGIAAALQHDSLTAVNRWTAAQQKGSHWATLNLQTLQKNARSSPSPPQPAKGIEEIEQYPLDDFWAMPNIDREIKVAEMTYCGYKQFKNSRLFVHSVNLGAQFVIVQETQQSYTGKTLRGIRLNDAQDKVLAAYGPAPRTVAQLGESVWVYPEAKLYFRISSESKVAAWGVYRKSDF